MFNVLCESGDRVSWSPCYGIGYRIRTYILVGGRWVAITYIHGAISVIGQPASTRDEAIAELKSYIKSALEAY